MEPPHSKTTLLFHIINTLKKNPKIIWKSRNQTPRSLLFPFSIPKFNENNTAIFHLLSGKTFRSILVTNRPSPLKRSSKDSIVFVQTLLKDLQVKVLHLWVATVPDRQITRLIFQRASLSLPVNSENRMCSRITLCTQGILWLNLWHLSRLGWDSVATFF